jgi:transposase InsO family protein
VKVLNIRWKKWPRLIGLGPELSREAKRRLSWIDHLREHGNVSFTARHFGIRRSTLYRVARRFDPYDLTSLEDRSKRPRRVRAPEWSKKLEQAVLRLRRQYPRWGKEKIVVLLGREGIKASPSTVGRIVKKLKLLGRLVEPRRVVTSRRRQGPRPFARRKPREYTPERPGDLIQLDTMDLRFDGVCRKQFSAKDMISKWVVAGVSRNASSADAARFLDVLVQSSPFAVKAIQVDGGSEFMLTFEQACCDRGISLFVLPPRSPKLNGQVERVNRTYREEFYEVEPLSLSVEILDQQVVRQNHIYNTIRPHHALGLKTPQEFLDNLRQNQPRLSPMY